MTITIRRREILAAFGSAAIAWPLVARAQQAAMPVIGYLVVGGPEDSQASLVPFLQGLKQSGYIQGKNVTIETRAANYHVERLQGLAAELVDHGAAMIFATQGAASVVAAKAVTSTIPIVFATGGDPIKLGLVPSLNHPGSNVTGISFLIGNLGGKRVELLHELAPKAKVFGFLANPSNAGSQSELADVLAAARTLGLQLVVMNATNDHEIDAAFAGFRGKSIDAFLNEADILFDTRREQLVARVAQLAVPAIYHFRRFVTAGGLMSYGTSSDDAQRLAGIYAGRILNGEKPSDLPVQQSTKVELVINLKTARALGLTFPITLLGRADEVIE